MPDDSLIHLRVPAATKGLWVRLSRARGMRLADWIVQRVEGGMGIVEIVAEVAAIAATLEDSPIVFKYPRANEGVEAMQQAAGAFAAAQDDAARLDAALWVGEAYLLFSSALPDTGQSEHSTAWATARQIAGLLGGPVVWEKRVRDAYNERRS